MPTPTNPYSAQPTSTNPYSAQPIPSARSAAAPAAQPISSVQSPASAQSPAQLRAEYNAKWGFFYYISGLAMKIYEKYKQGQGTDVYIALLAFLLRRDGVKEERGAQLPIFWDDLPTGDTCPVDLLAYDCVMIRVLEKDLVDTADRQQFQNRMELTHTPYGMIINFSPDRAYSEWYARDPETGVIDKIKLIK